MQRIPRAEGTSLQLCVAQAIRPRVFHRKRSNSSLCAAARLASGTLLVAYGFDAHAPTHFLPPPRLGDREPLTRSLAEITAMLLLMLTLLVVALAAGANVVCSPGYTCAQDPTSSTVWAMTNAGNTNGPSCQRVCEGALGQSNAFYSCDASKAVFSDAASFARIAALLGFRFVQFK